MPFGSTKRFQSQGGLKVSTKEYLIIFVTGHKYLGVTLDPSLNTSDHLQKTLTSVTARIKLLKRMRHSLSDLAVRSMCGAPLTPHILLTN